MENYEEAKAIDTKVFNESFNENFGKVFITEKVTTTTFIAQLIITKDHFNNMSDKDINVCLKEFFDAINIEVIIDVIRKDIIITPTNNNNNIKVICSCENDIFIDVWEVTTGIKPKLITTSKIYKVKTTE